MIALKPQREVVKLFRDKAAADKSCVSGVKGAISSKWTGLKKSTQIWESGKTINYRHVDKDGQRSVTTFVRPDFHCFATV